MLSPSINVAQALLTQALNEVLLLDSYATTTGNTMIGRLPKDPDWLASVRNRVGLLGQAGAAWTRAKPEIWGAVLLQFTDYASTFAGVAATQKQGLITTTAQWIAVLTDVLLTQLDQAMTATSAAAVALAQRYQAFKDVMPLLEASINAGWKELQSEESQMVAIAEQLTSLQDLVGSLADEVTAGVISSGQDVATATVTMLYNVATEVGESFSFLSMATGVLTVGKSYYDLITQTDAAADALRKIAALQLEASQEAQAAAGTKMVLQLVYELRHSFDTITDVLPQISTLWTTERQKVQDAIHAIQAGANPADLFDLLTIPVANANWQAIDTFALAIPTLKQSIGRPVTLNPQDPIPGPR